MTTTRPNSEAPALKLAARLRLELEFAVRGFKRRDRYDIGQTLRNEATAVSRIATMAWREPALRSFHLRDLARALDGLVLTMQLAQEARAFVSVDQFAAIHRTASELGRQVGGWIKKQHAKGQNEGPHAASQRAQILSAHAASTFEAHP